MPPPPSPPAGGAGQRAIAFSAVALGTFMATLDASVVNVALPTLAREFDAGLGSVEWVVLSYLLALVALQLNAGRLSDLMGRGRVYAVGLGIFALASAACAAAESLGFLIGARVVQGIGGAMTSAVGTAIVTEVFPPQARGRALGWLGLAVSAGLAAGPAIGGLVIDAFSWRWLFLPNVPLAGIAALAALRAAPGRSASAGERFDPLGSLFLALGLTSLTLALSLGSRLGVGHPLVLACAALVPILGLAFLWTERRHPAPVVDLGMFRDRVFAGSAAAGFLVFVTVGAVNLVMPFHLSDGLGLDTRQMGLVLSALPIALAAAAPVSGTAADRTGAVRAIATGGAVAAALALGALHLVAGRGTGPAGIAACMAGIGLAVGTFQSPNNTALMSAATSARLGTAGGILASVRVTGMLVGNSTGAAIYSTAPAGRGLSVAALVGAAAGVLAALASAARGRTRVA